MKKRILAVLLMAAMALTLTGCVSVSIGGASGITVNGNGKIISRSYNMDSFDSVEINGEFELIYRSGGVTGVELEMHENLFEYVELSVNNGRLLVNSTANILTNSDQTPKLYVTAPEFKALVIRGLVTMYNADMIIGERFDIRVSGACDVNARLDVERLDVDISGAGTLTLQGTAEEAAFKLSGAGSIDALDLEAVEASVSVSGAGSCSISCSGRLDAQISGVGDITYRGEPQVVSNVSGMGSIKKAA